MSEQLRILAIGAHPDDCEVCLAGMAALWADRGHLVRFVSATNGGTGHHIEGGAALVRRRIAEAAAAARVLGIESQVLPIPNGEIEPSLVYRRMFIRLIREFAPDLIITHRPNDYHPDHRYTSQLVSDSAYVVMVPNNVPETPPLRHNPVIAYFRDDFRKPIPFQPDVVIDIDSVLPRKNDALHCHASQMYEWLPWSMGRLDEVPAGDDERKAWLMSWRYRHERVWAERCRDRLVERYGRERGQAVRHVEVLEACEYGGELDEAQMQRLFGGM